MEQERNILQRNVAEIKIEMGKLQEAHQSQKLESDNNHIEEVIIFIHT